MKMGRVTEVVITQIWSLVARQVWGVRWANSSRLWSRHEGTGEGGRERIQWFDVAGSLKSDGDVFEANNLDNPGH